MSSRPPANNDTRYTPRDRSPPRYERERRNSGPFDRPVRNSDPDRRETAGSGGGADRDIPRGPKALEGGGRSANAGPAPIPPSGPRAGARTLRDAPPLPDAHSSRNIDRSWRNDRDRDFRDRRPSPRGRSPLRESRDSRDNRDRDFRENRDRDNRDNREFPRDLDIGRAQRGVRDGPPSAGSNYSDPPQTGGFGGRGGFRSRGRGDWEPRGRGRGFHNNDDRDRFRPRSRSRGPPFGRDGPRDGPRNRAMDDRDIDPRGNRDRFDNRRDDSYRNYGDRDDRDTDRYKPSTRVDSWTAADSRSGKLGSASPHVTPVSTSNVDRFGGPDSAGPPDSRRSSVVGAPGSKDARRDSEKTDHPAARTTQLARERFQNRESSEPVQAPSVPAFGAISLTTPRATSNVWRAPTVESKPIPPPVAAPAPASTPAAVSPTKQTVTPAPQPPSAPKALAAVPPTGPRASRSYEQLDAKETKESWSADEVMKDVAPPSKPAVSTPVADRAAEVKQAPSAPAPIVVSPPIGPAAITRQTSIGPSASVRPNPNTVPLGPARAPRDASPPVAIPLGPRNTAPFAVSPKSTPSNIPTGPRADRGQVPPRAQPYGWVDRQVPSISPRSIPSKNLVWNNPNPTPTAPAHMRTSPQSTIPAKRDANGEERERIPPSRPSFGPNLSQAFPSSNVWDPNASMSGTNARSVPNSMLIETRQPEPRPSLDETKAETETKPKPEDAFSDVEMGEASPTFDRSNLMPPSSAPNEGLSEDEDALVLDESDFVEAEKKFQREKQLLEAKKIDLSDRSLRAVTPLEEIVLLNTITMDDIEYLRAQHAERTKPVVPKPPVEEPISPKTTRILPQPEVLTPKREDDDVSMQGADDQKDIASESDRDGTPEDIELPFLKDGPPTPLSDRDYEPRRLSDEKAEAIKKLYALRLGDVQGSENRLKDQFEASYRHWRKEIDVTDEETKAHEEEERGVSIEPRAATTPDPGQMPALPSSSLRRQNMAIASEYMLEKVLEQSKKEHDEAQAALAREAKNSNPDLEKEAEIPVLLISLDQGRRKYANTNRLREARQTFTCFHYEPPADDFTEQEHKTLVATYHAHPKQWGFLAQQLPGRNFAQCINHYYTTKWNKEYKPRLGKRAKGARSRAAKAGAARGRAPANTQALPELGEDGQPIVAVTDSGRPRRAAAPQFGGPEPEIETPIPLPTGRGRGQTGEAGPERGAKRQRTTKEKVPRKSKNAQLLPATATTPVPASSPIKQPRDKAEKLMGVKQEEVSSVRGDVIEHAQIMPPMPPTMSLDEPPPMVIDEFGRPLPPSLLGDSPSINTPPGATRPRAGTNTSRSGHSSYWSVQEQTDFKANVAHFGTDFMSISEHMGTKTSTMVKNQYQRMVEGGNIELQNSALEADRKKENGIERGPPPQPTAQPVRRTNYNVPTTAVPRPLAPNTEAMDIDNSPPVALAPAQASPPLAPSMRGYPAVAQSGSSRPKPMPLQHTQASPPTLNMSASEIPQLSPPGRMPSHFAQDNIPPLQPQPPRRGPAFGTFEQSQGRPGPPPLQANAPPPMRHDPQRGPVHPREQQRSSFLPATAASPPNRAGGLATAGYDQPPRIQQQPPPPSVSSAQMAPTPTLQERPQHGFAPPRHMGGAVGPPQPVSLQRSTGPPTSAALEPRGTPIHQPQVQQPPIPQPPSLAQQSPHVRHHLMESPVARSPLSQPQLTSERHPSLFAREEPRQANMPTSAPPTAPPPPKPAARKQSDLFSLLNADTPAEKPRTRSPAPPAPSALRQSHSVSHTPVPTQPPSLYTDSRSQPPQYGQSTFVQPGQIPSRPPSRVMAEPPRHAQQHGSMQSSQGWEPRSYGQPQPQPAVSQSNTPMPGRPTPPNVPTEPRHNNFSNSHRAMAFGQHAQPRVNPSPPPPPPHAAYSHSRATSYSQTPHPPPSVSQTQAPSRMHTPPVVPGDPPVLQNNPYARLSQPASATSSHPPHMQSSQTPLSERSYAHNQGLPYAAQHSAPSLGRGISITDKLNQDPREQEIQMQRERDMREREQQQLEHERAQREREDRDQRERYEQQQQQQHHGQNLRYGHVGGHHTPHDPNARYAPPPPPPPQSHTPAPYSLGGRGPPQEQRGQMQAQERLGYPRGAPPPEQQQRPRVYDHHGNTLSVSASERERERYDRDGRMREVPPPPNAPHGQSQQPPQGPPRVSHHHAQQQQQQQQGQQQPLYAREPGPGSREYEELRQRQELRDQAEMRRQQEFREIEREDMEERSGGAIRR